jgi:hypothetical protein
MIVAIRGMEASGYFRFSDAGDIQSVEHLRAIVNVAKALPGIKFWLPTREHGMLAEYVRCGGDWPDNLTVRISSLKIDGEPPALLAKRLGVQTSSVSKGEGFNCPSSKQGNKCLTCRACWDKGATNVAYKYH